MPNLTPPSLSHLFIYWKAILTPILSLERYQEYLKSKGKDEDKIDIRPFISEQKYIPKEGDKIVALQPPKMSVLKESYLQNESEAVS